MDPHHHHPCHHAASCCRHCYSTHQPPYQTPQVNFQIYPHNPQIYTSTPAEPHDPGAISSLLRRVAALESSLLRRVPSGRYSLRDAAARTIQTCFRAFLVRRSRTLRQLKTLASIKAALNALKKSVSDGTRFDSRGVSRKAMDLLLKLESIKGGDSMVRDGKRLISRDLDLFLGSIGLSVKKNRLSGTGPTSSRNRVLYNAEQIDTAAYVSFGREERGMKERMRAHVESVNGFYHVPDNHEDETRIIEVENFRIQNNGKVGSLLKRKGGLAKSYNGNQSIGKKKVSFAEDGDLSRVLVSTHDPNSSEDDSVDEEVELVDNLRRRVQKISVIPNENGDDDQEAYSEDEESSQISNGDESSKRGLRAKGNYQPR